MTKADDYRALHARIVAGAGPDRELDKEISATFFKVVDHNNTGNSWFIVDPVDWREPRSKWHYQKPYFTTSIDAAVALCEQELGHVPSLTIEHTTPVPPGEPEWRVVMFTDDNPASGNHDGNGLALPRAILAALMLVLIAREEAT